MKTLNDFRSMWDAYPVGTSEEAKARIGGAVNAAWITNTCVVRVSRSMNYSGNDIPGDHAGLYTVNGADAKRYAIRVHELGVYLRAVYGEPQETYTYQGKGGEAPASFSDKHGIICFDVNAWSDATGHFDLWDGQRCINHAYFDLASKVYLWIVPDGEGRTQPPDEPKITLSGAVGEGGANRADDVQRVQTLLAAHGLDVVVDGVVSPGMVAAIRAFQKAFASSPDGRVDPGGRTLQELLRR